VEDVFIIFVACMIAGFAGVWFGIIYQRRMTDINGASNLLMEMDCPWCNYAVTCEEGDAVAKEAIRKHAESCDANPAHSMQERLDNLRMANAHMSKSHDAMKELFENKKKVLTDLLEKERATHNTEMESLYSDNAKLKADLDGKDAILIARNVLALAVLRGEMDQCDIVTKVDKLDS
jgi:hypothetical protein